MIETDRVSQRAAIDRKRRARMNLWDWFVVMVRGELPPENRTDQDIARQAYADFLRAQLIGFAPQAAADLLAKLTEENGFNTASFAMLMGVETQLAGQMTDEQISRNYWMVRDRLNRVGALAAIREHNAWAPEELLRKPNTPDSSPLVIAREAAASAIATVGATAIALADRQAALASAGSGATDEQRAAVADAGAAHKAAILAAAAATQRVTELEAAVTNDAPIAPEDDAESDEPSTDAAALAKQADEAEADARLAQSTQIAAEESAGPQFRMVSQEEIDAAAAAPGPTEDATAQEPDPDDEGNTETGAQS